jgi:hypothetical protein
VLLPGGSGSDSGSETAWTGRIATLSSRALPARHPVAAPRRLPTRICRAVPHHRRLRQTSPAASASLCSSITQSAAHHHAPRSRYGGSATRRLSDSSFTQPLLSLSPSEASQLARCHATVGHDLSSPYVPDERFNSPLSQERQLSRHVERAMTAGTDWPLCA